MTDSLSKKNRTFFVPAIGHKPSAICSDLTPYVIGSLILGRGGGWRGLTSVQTEMAPFDLLAGQRIVDRDGILSTLVAYRFVNSVRFGLVDRTGTANLIFGISDWRSRYSIEKLTATDEHIYAAKTMSVRPGMPIHLQRTRPYIETIPRC